MDLEKRSTMVSITDLPCEDGTPVMKPIEMWNLCRGGDGTAWRELSVLKLGVGKVLIVCANSERFLGSLQPVSPFLECHYDL